MKNLINKFVIYFKILDIKIMLYMAKIDNKNNTYPFNVYKNLYVFYKWYLLRKIIKLKK